jgi:two-component system nitrogen regulation sensor histidine kinase GlnL
MYGAQISAETCLKCNLLEGIDQTQKLGEISSTAATLAHGVRNPLNAIKGSVVYIREKYAGEKRLIQFIKIIEEEIARLDAFIAHYLSTSISQKSIDTIDINSVLEKIEILTSLQVQSRKLKALYELGCIRPVKINPFQLEQAILNVINNAMEAMSPGGQLTIKTKSLNRSGTRFALVEISDTGCGIAKDLPGVISSQNKGRGFGLFITHEILRSVGGHLEIKSERGTGTIVRLYFPCD